MPSKPKLEALPPVDMTMEDLSRTNPEIAAELNEVFERTPLEDITRETGLGLNELSQVISVEVNGETRSGTFAAAISDPRCPAGKMVRNRYANKGIDGVQRMLGDWAEDEPGMTITLSRATLERHQQPTETVTTPDNVVPINQAAERLKKK